MKTISLLCVIAMFAFQVLWHGWVSPASVNRWSMMLIALSPSLLVAWFWQQSTWRGMVVANLFGLIYICHGVIVVMTEHRLWAKGLGVFEIGICVALTASLMRTAIQARKAKRMAQS